MASKLRKDLRRANEEAQRQVWRLLQLSEQEMMVVQIKVVKAVAESVFIFKEEPTEFPDRLDMEYERKTESNTTPRFLTHASGRMGRRRL